MSFEVLSVPVLQLDPDYVPVFLQVHSPHPPAFNRLTLPFFFLDFLFFSPGLQVTPCPCDSPSLNSLRTPEDSSSSRTLPGDSLSLVPPSSKIMTQLFFRCLQCVSHTVHHLSQSAPSCGNIYASRFTWKIWSTNLILPTILFGITSCIVYSPIFFQAVFSLITQLLKNI